MKKLLKRRKIFMIAAIILLFGSVQTATFGAETALATEIKEGGKLLEQSIKKSSITNQKEAALTSEQKNFFEDYCDICYFFQEEAPEGELYPEEVAGVYYEDGIGIVVDVTENSENIEQQLENVVGQEEKIAVNVVDYSYQELEEQKEEIESKCQTILLCDNSEAKELVQKITSIDVDEQENQVVVGIDKLSNKDKETFVKYICKLEKIILVENNEKVTPCSTELKPGMRIYGDRIEDDEVWEAYSLGCRAWRITSSGRYEYGFITAAHSNIIGTKFYADSNYIGYVSDRKLGGSVDASFVNIQNSSYTVSNKIAYGSNALTSRKYVYEDFVGLPCIAVGASTGTFRVGRVEFENVVGHYEEYGTNKTIEFNNFLGVKLNRMLLPGDSGGLLYTMIDDDYCVLGILSCMNGKYNYFVKYS